MAPDNKESMETKIALLKRDVGFVLDELKVIKKLIEDKYVTKEEWQPYKTILNSLIGLILLAVIGAVLTLVIKR
jgi:hypothetical protein